MQHYFVRNGYIDEMVELSIGVILDRNTRCLSDVKIQKMLDNHASHQWKQNDPV